MGRGGAERRIAELDIEHEAVLEALDGALDLMTNIRRAYVQAGRQERRLLNQAFFERLEIVGEEVVRHGLAEPFAAARDPEPAEEEDTET